MSNRPGVLMIGGTGTISTDCTRLALESGRFELFLLNRGKTPNFLPGPVNTIRADVMSPEAEEKLAGYEFDIVCDFISYRPEELERKLRLLRNRCGCYIFVSSVMACRPDPYPVKTEANSRIGNTNWDYGWNKSLCEKLLREECARTGMRFTIVRPGYTYNDIRFFNPWTIPHPESWTIADRMLRGKPIVLQDGGEALSTVTHTADFAKGFVGLWNNPAAVNEVFHLTGAEHLSWRRIAEIEAELLGVKADLRSVPAETLCFEFGHSIGQKIIRTTMDDCYDNARLRAAVPEFACTTDFRSGIARNIRFHHDHPEFRIVSAWWNDRFDASLSNLFKYY